MNETEEPPLQIAVIHGDLHKPFPTYPNGDWASNDYGVIDQLRVALAELRGFDFTYLYHHDTLFQDLQAGGFDLVLQLCDDGYMNNPDMAAHICAMLDMIGLPYTGSGLKAMMLTSDKQFELDIARQNGVPVPESRLVQPWEPLPTDIRFPALVKANAADGSLGLTHKNVVHNQTELAAAFQRMRDQFQIEGPLLIQQYLGGRDIFVSLIGNPPDDFCVLTMTEEDYSALPPDLPKICGYESKWDPTSPYWQITSQPTTLSPEKQAFIIDCCKRLYTRLDIRDYARFDWRLDENDEPYFLEVNPNCAWCFDGHLAKTAALSGLSYSDLLRLILETSLRRYQQVPHRLAVEVPV
jgi:D-alanine-D-alanine ligase